MEFVISSDQNYFFEKNGYIEFEGIFKPQEILRLKNSLDTTLKARLKDKPNDWYAKTRDLWRDSPEIARTLLNGNLGKVSSELIHQRPLRLACDQWIFGGKELPFQNSLAKSFPFQGIEIGALIALNTIEESPSPLFPKKAGNVLFLNRYVQLDGISPADYLLVVIANAKAVYALQQNDPGTHTLKQIGYNFGDKLNDNDHPYLIR